LRCFSILRPFPIVWPSEVDLQRALWDYARFHLSHGLSVMDALIAATATGQGMPLATFNVRHFVVIPGLITEQPYVR
jgi:hypothetical protein